MQFWQLLLRLFRARRRSWAPPAGLAAWYYGDSLTDGQWTDRSGHDRHATITGSPPDADGIVGQSYASEDAYDPAATLSVCYWLYTQYSVANTGAVHVGSFDLYALKISGMWSSSTTIYVDWRNESAGRMYYTFPPEDKNAWAHIAIVASSTRRVFYRNGVVVESDTDVVTGNTGTGLQVGRCRMGTAWHYLRPGSRIDDVMVVNALLSEEQIADIYAHSPGSHA